MVVKGRISEIVEKLEFARGLDETRELITFFILLLRRDYLLSRVMMAKYFVQMFELKNPASKIFNICIRNKDFI